MTIDRRQFLGGASALGLSALVPGCATPRRPRAVVLGAGLAGLSAARQLVAEFGEESVVVLEARSRPGGRVSTVEKAGLRLEEGGQVLASSYERFLGLAAELGVEVREARGERPRSLFFLGGSPYAEDQWASQAEGLLPEERQLPPAALLSRYVGQENPLATLEAWLTDHPELDRLSLADLLRQRGASSAALELMNLAPNCNDLETASALWALRDHHRRRGAPGAIVEVVGGNARLPQALAESLGSSVRYGREVEALRASAEGVRVVCADGEVFEAETIVCTLPFTVVRTLDLEAALSSSFEQAVDELPYTQITKVFLEVLEPFWEVDGAPPGMWTDSVLERIFPLQKTDGSGVGGLICWADGPSAVRLAEMEESEMETFVLGELARMRPATEGRVRYLHRSAWPRDPYALGAYHHFGVGQINAFAEALLEPQGPLFFAGEHTSVRMAGMEGALESADCAAAQVLERLRAADAA